jgi:two-component system, LytTR family, sensor kinase
MTTSVASTAPGGDRPARISWPITIGLFGVATVLRFAYFYLDDLTRRLHGTLVTRLIEEITGNVASALFFPIAVLAERRFPLDAGRWRRNWSAHVVGYVVYSGLHTSFLAASRAVLFPALGQGSYDYGILTIRYFMESSQDLFSYAAFIAILTLIRVQHKLRDRELRAAVLERDAASARLDALSARLQPHFLFNALNTISSKAYEDPVVADELIGRLGDLLRESLHAGGRAEIPLGEELRVLAAYLAFVDARFGDRIRCAVDVDPTATDLAVPAFLLQPLVENAVRHGASSDDGVAEISVVVRPTPRGLSLVVENDSPADGSEAPTFGTGLGATRDRLAILYGSAASIHASANDGKFRATITLPARHAEPSPANPELVDAGAHR